MNPIYNEYIKFLHDNNINLDIKEGYYWLDNQIIKAYDKQGILHKVYRIKVDYDLNLSYSTYKEDIFEIESWEETMNRNLTELKNKEQESLKLVKSKLDEYKEYEPFILNSGGKDSLVTTYIVRKVKHDVTCLFNNTSLDCADTYKQMKNMENCLIINPKEGFYQWIDRLKFVPTRLSRACCTLFKEESTMNYLDANKKLIIFLGMRNEESVNRSTYQDEWRNTKWGDKDWQGILPIREWSEEEIWLYTFWKGIDVNTKYKKGYSRVGCAIACPNYSKSTWVLDKYWYPTLFKRWHIILEKDFLENYKWTKINCTKREYHMEWCGGLLRKEPTSEVISEFAEYMKLDFEVAKKYFGHKCKVCNKNVNKKDDIAMNLKLIGRNIDDYYCKKHLIEKMGIDKQYWDKAISDFKKDGCSLF